MTTDLLTSLQIYLKIVYIRRLRPTTSFIIRIKISRSVYFLCWRPLCCRHRGLCIAFSGRLFAELGQFSDNINNLRVPVASRLSFSKLQVSSLFFCVKRYFVRIGPRDVNESHQHRKLEKYPQQRYIESCLFQVYDDMFLMEYVDIQQIVFRKH